MAEGGGWIARAARIVAEDGTDSRAAAFLNVAGAFEAAGGGDLERAARIAEECVRAARRLGSAEYAALSLHQQGLFLLAAGHTDEGLACLDEAMLGVASGECSALVEGIIYCGVIEGCWSIYELTRAQQWTAAMTQWVAAQPDLGNFTGECKVRRAELKQFNGRWPEALDELAAVSLTDPDMWAVRPGRQRAREPRPAAAAGSTRPRSTSRSRRSSARTRSPGSRCFGWPAGACRPRPPWSGARSRRRTRPAGASRCSPAATEILLAVGDDRCRRGHRWRAAGPRCREPQPGGDRSRPARAGVGLSRARCAGRGAPAAP